MTSMDLNSLSWFGDVCQKFESLCVVVEETMYEDTVKYVQEQMWTAGENFKKLYSEVVQDFLPHSPSNAVEKENPLLFGVHGADVKARKNPEVNVENFGNIEVEENVDDFEGAANGENCVSCAPCHFALASVDKLYEPNSHDAVEEQGANEDLDFQCDEFDLPDPEDFECKSPFDTSSSNVFMTKDFLEELYPTEFHDESGEPLFGLSDVTSMSASVAEKTHSEKDEGGIPEQMTEGNGSVVLDNESETAVPSSGNLSAGLEVCSRDADIATAFTVEGSNSQDVNLSLFVPDTGSEIIFQGKTNFPNQQLDKVTLGESCILVEKSEPSSATPLEHTHKSYKKKIRNALIPMRWSKGKLNQKQRPVWYEEQIGKDLAPTSLIPASMKNSQFNESLESEWELL